VNKGFKMRVGTTSLVEEWARYEGNGEKEWKIDRGMKNADCEGTPARIGELIGWMDSPG